MENLDIIKKFLAQISNWDHILGIIFYGSCQYKTDHPSSDIDLLLITDQEKNIKGTTYIKDKKVEFFERNIFSLMEKISKLDHSLDRSLVSIFTNGKILYSKNNIVELLKEEVLSKKESYPKMDKSLSTTQDILFYQSEIDRLSKKEPLFLYYYYNLLEIARQEYHREYGYSKLPTMKVYDLYSNPDYAKNYYCVRLPKADFRTNFLDLITKEDNQEKLEDLLSKISSQEKDSSFEYPCYSKIQIRYFSTAVKNAVDKSNQHLIDNYPDYLFCYYNALNKIRKLHHSLNRIENTPDLMNIDYDDQFFSLFTSYIKKPQNLEPLFQYVSKPIDIDYTNYKVLELQ